MKVVFYSTSAEDLVRYRLPVARRLRDAGYSIVFAGPGGEYAARAEQDSFAYRRLAPSLEGTGPLRDAAAGIRLGGIYRDEQPDIVHHFTLHGLVSGAIAARISHVPWVVQSVPALAQNARGMSPMGIGGRRVLRFALRDAQVTFRTHEDRQVLVSRGCVRPEETHIIATSGIELSAYPFHDEPDRTPVAAMIGPLRDPAAIGTFVDAAGRLQADGVGARFVLISTHEHGPAVDRGTLNTWMEEGLVEWWGPRRHLADVLAKIHVVYAAEQHGRETPLLLLEAAACGRPLIAADNAAARRLIRDDQVGRLVSPQSVEDLAAALGDLLRDRQRRRCMGKTIRRLIESEFSAERVAQQTMAVYERLFERGREI